MLDFICFHGDLGAYKHLFLLIYVVCHQWGRRNVTEVTILQLDIFPAERLGVTDLHISYGLECIF